MADVNEKKFLGTEGVQQLIANTRGEIAEAEQAAKNYADGLADNYDAAGTAATKVKELEDGKVKALEESLAEGGATALAIEAAKQAGIDAASTLENGKVKALEESLAEGGATAEAIKAAKQAGIDAASTLENGQVKINKEAIGTMDSLETTNKSDLVSALNEVRNAVSAGGTAAAITMSEQTTGLGDGILKAYTIKQGENTVGTINIPKDMVVQSGEVVVNPDGQAAGTYIKLVLANATNDVIYVNVGTLVDIYTAKASAAQVQLAIDSSTREISASIVAGSITATELAADAVTTVKIADGNVTKAKLSTELQASIDKADAAAQDATDKANAAEQAAKGHADSLNSAMDTRVEALEAIDHDHVNATQLATYDKTQTELLAAAKAEAEGLIGGVDLSGIAINAADIGKIETSLDEGGATANAIAAAHKAGTDAATAVSTLETGKVKALEDKADEFDSLIGKDGILVRDLEAAKKTAGDAVTAINTLENGTVAANAGKIAAIEASLAENGDTYKAIEAAKQAGLDAVEHLANNDVASNTSSINALSLISHTHLNEEELNKIDIGDKAKWDASEQNAKDYADGLNTSMNTRVAALESVSYVEITASEIDAMFAAQA